MLIGSGLETDIVALSSLKTGNAVCQHDLVGVSDMWLAGCIGDSRCNIIWFLTFFTHFFHSSCQENAQLFCLSTVTGIPAFSVPFSNSFVNILLRFWLEFWLESGPKSMSCIDRKYKLYCL